MACVPESVVLLHGFAGTHRAFDGVIAALAPERYRPLALDLPGHGATWPLRGELSFASAGEHVLAHAPSELPTLCGYSMGGRMALHVALAAPERVGRLVLVSTGAGIESEEARSERRRSDERLARELEDGDFERFIERWRSQPLFAGEPPAARALALEDHRRNRPQALAAALRALGPGQMEPLWGRLAELRMPVLVMAGERDGRYCEIASRMVAALPRGQLEIVAGGHSLLLENPLAVAGAIARDAATAAPSPGRPSVAPR